MRFVNDHVPRNLILLDNQSPAFLLHTLWLTDRSYRPTYRTDLLYNSYCIYSLFYSSFVLVYLEAMNLGFLTSLLFKEDINIFGTLFPILLYITTPYNMLTSEC